jgi:hypothetical protein
MRALPLHHHKTRNSPLYPHIPSGQSSTHIQIQPPSLVCPLPLSLPLPRPACLSPALRNLRSARLPTPPRLRRRPVSQCNWIQTPVDDSASFSLLRCPCCGRTQARRTSRVKGISNVAPPLIRWASSTRAMSPWSGMAAQRIRGPWLTVLPQRTAREEPAP